MKPTVIFCDFDGTIFDSDVRMFLAPWYNRLSSRLLDRTDTFFAVTTGRHSWGPWTRLNYAIAGMRRPDVIVAGAGTKIYWRKDNGYVLDEEWNKLIKNAFNKPAVQKVLSGFLTEKQLKEYAVPNDQMIVVTLYGKRIDEVLLIQKKMSIRLSEFKVKIILSEQLFFKNTRELFNGYALIVPDMAGKDNSARHILQQYEKTHQEPVNMLSFGDASIDVSLLTMERPTNMAKYESYGVHLTPLARELVKNHKTGTIPTLLEGSAPRSIYHILKAHYRDSRNSPYRIALAPFEAAIDRLVYPSLTPNELTARGLDDVRRGLKQKGLAGFLSVLKGHLIDAVDGIRARRRPELKTPEGQLFDVYADRTKEFESLMARNQPKAALSCILPSIARAQAETLGKTVPELDAAGGSALSRTRRLLTSLLFHTLGFPSASEKTDHEIEQSNLATYQRRRDAAKGFSWDISHLRKYDRVSLERLLVLVDLLQTQYSNVSKKETVNIPELKEYLEIKTKPIRTQLKLPISKIVMTS